MPIIALTRRAPTTCRGSGFIGGAATASLCRCWLLRPQQKLTRQGQFQEPELKRRRWFSWVFSLYTRYTTQPNPAGLDLVSEEEAHPWPTHDPGQNSSQLRIEEMVAALAFDDRNQKEAHHNERANRG